ncbi:GrpB family protein [Metabacillus sp. KIGAM252]|uniref:GrpB family protein n=1 Tax=Metabacillus flavus TaxID=2823519 RepID=A0ABS5LD63_9BACI|nr:GrpB family protein [Metabacillus flavus]MBS2968675.1 GrpB family protein [Metabacillus flavus]
MKIELIPYQKSWQGEFAFLKKRLEHLLAPLEPEIEHIGSTSVPGLCAKPIIDIMAGLREEAELDDAARLLEETEFFYMSVYNEQTPFRRFFIGAKNDAEPGEVIHKNRSCHLHIVPVKSDWWRDHLLFKDYLKRNDAARDTYARVKKELSMQEWPHGNDYANAKTEVIRNLLMEAKKSP